MASSILELIAVNIEAAINTIKVATTVQGNAYHNDLTAIRPRRVDFPDASWKSKDVLISQLAPEEVAGVMGTAEYNQPFMIFAIIIDGDSASASIDTRLNQVSADIIKALEVDIYRGGNALNTTITNPGETVYDDEGESTGVMVIAEVHYRIKINDPYTKG